MASDTYGETDGGEGGSACGVGPFSAGDAWVPLTDAHTVAALDRAEIVEGYHDGRANEPRPGPNRSTAYRHGWWVGQADGGHRQPDARDMELIASMREARLGVFDPDLFGKRRPSPQRGPRQ